MTAFDIAIIGAGPAGLSVALCLAGSGLSVALVERAPEASLADPAFDGREIALTHRSQALLKQLGAWDHIPAAEVSPLREAAVLDGASPFALRFTPEGVGKQTPSVAETGGDPLGALVPNHLIRRALFQALAASGGATLVAGTAVAGLETSPRGARLALSDGRRIAARLVVAADTRFSEARRRMGIGATLRDFGKTMLVARLAHDRRITACPRNWFRHGQTSPCCRSTAGLLGRHHPARCGDRGAARAAGRRIRAARSPAATETGWAPCAWSPPATPIRCRDLCAAFPWARASRWPAMRRWGCIGHRAWLQPGPRRRGPPRAGHPRRRARGRDPADPGALLAYERGHRLATWPLFAATNAIAGLYTDDRAPARLLRAAVLRAGAALGPARRLVTRELMQPA